MFRPLLLRSLSACRMSVLSGQSKVSWPSPSSLIGPGVPAGVGTSSLPFSPGSVGSDRKSTRLNSSHSQISYAVFCLKKKTFRSPRRLARRARLLVRDKQRLALRPSDELSQPQPYRFAEYNELRPRLPPCAVRRACRRSRRPRLLPSSLSDCRPVTSSARVECASLRPPAGRCTCSAAARRESFLSASSSTPPEDVCDKSKH